MFCALADHNGTPKEFTSYLVLKPKTNILLEFLIRAFIQCMASASRVCNLDRHCSACVLSTHVVFSRKHPLLQDRSQAAAIFTRELAVLLRQVAVSQRKNSVTVKHFTLVLLKPAGMASPAHLRWRLGFRPRPFKSSALTACHPRAHASRSSRVIPGSSALKVSVTKIATCIS